MTFPKTLGNLILFKDFFPGMEITIKKNVHDFPIFSSSQSCSSVVKLVSTFCVLSAAVRPASRLEYLAAMLWVSCCWMWVMTFSSDSRRSALCFSSCLLWSFTAAWRLPTSWRAGGIRKGEEEVEGDEVDSTPGPVVGLIRGGRGGGGG